MSGTGTRLAGQRQNFTSQKLRVELTTALSELALASGGVVSVLEENGIKGTMGSDDLCPVALWLGARVNAEVHVGIRHVRARQGQHSAEVPTPGEISDFVAQFDAGHCPQLVSPFHPGARQDG